MKTEKELRDNPWADAHKYADSIYHMTKDDDIFKYEKYEEIKEAFEVGYRQALEDYADKKYTEEDLRIAFDTGYYTRDSFGDRSDNMTAEEYIKSLNKQD